MDRPVKNGLEWTVFALSLALVLATMGYLVNESLGGKSGPADVVVTLGTPVRLESGHLVPVQVVNRGTTTAEEVRVPVYLHTAEGEREEAELTVDFLPADSRRDGWVSFRSDPARGTLGIGPVAFEVP